MVQETTKTTIRSELRKKWDTAFATSREIFPKNKEILDKRFNVDLLNTIGHELNHLITAHKNNIPLAAMTLTAIRNGDTLGMVTLPDHVDYATFQEVAMAGAVDTPDGAARGYGSDLFKAEIIEYMGKGTSVSDAKDNAAAKIASYDRRLRQAMAVIIAYLQYEKHMSYIPGEMLPEIERRARMELELEQANIKLPLLFEHDEKKPETVEATLGKPPDRRTEVYMLPHHMLKIQYITDGMVEGEAVVICAVCGGRGEHLVDCNNLQNTFEKYTDKNKRIRTVTEGQTGKKTNDKNSFKIFDFQDFKVAKDRKVNLN